MKEQIFNLKTHIGLRIKYIRNIRKLSIIKSAKALGISRKQFQNYEKGITDIKISRLHEIAKLMNVSILFFLENYEENSKNNLSNHDKIFLINYSKIKNKEIKNILSNLLYELS